MWRRKRKQETVEQITERMIQKYERRHPSGPPLPLRPGEAAMVDPVLYRMIAEEIAKVRDRGLLVEDQEP